MINKISEISFNGVIKTQSSEELISLVVNRVENTVSRVELNTLPKKTHYLTTGDETKKLIEFLSKAYNRYANPKALNASLDKHFNYPQPLNLQFRANIDYAIKKLKKV